MCCCRPHPTNDISGGVRHPFLGTPSNGITPPPPFYWHPCPLTEWTPLHSSCRRLPDHIVCKITQRNNIRRANTCDPALKLLNEEITSDMQKHKQNIWKEHLDVHWDHRHSTHILWKTIHEVCVEYVGVYVLTMLVCMCFIFVLICAFFRMMCLLSEHIDSVI